LVFLSLAARPQGDELIEAVVERCAGIDVGKKFLIVCVMTGPLETEPKTEIRKFGTILAELELLRDWLIREGCSHAVMESTGPYWKPVFNILEDSVEVVLANAYDVQNRRGHKTDPNDSRWLAHLLRHGMIRASFIPEHAVRELRDLTRRRRQLVGEKARERNRIQKILEDANIKLGDVLGLSGRLMINAVLEGVMQTEEIAQLAQRKAKQKIPDLIVAVQRNRLTDHHLFLAARTPPSRFPGSGGRSTEHRNPIPAQHRTIQGKARPCCNRSLVSKKKLPLRFLPKLVRTWRSSHPTPTWRPGLTSAPAITKAPAYARLAIPIAATTGFAVFWLSAPG
jgi:transposase